MTNVIRFCVPFVTIHDVETVGYPMINRILLKMSWRCLKQWQTLPKVSVHH